MMSFVFCVWLQNVWYFENERTEIWSSGSVVVVVILGCGGEMNRIHGRREYASFWKRVG